MGLVAFCHGFDFFLTSLFLVVVCTPPEKEEGEEEREREEGALRLGERQRYPSE